MLLTAKYRFSNVKVCKDILNSHFAIDHARSFFLNQFMCRLIGLYFFICKIIVLQR